MDEKFTKMLANELKETKLPEDISPDTLATLLSKTMDAQQSDESSASEDLIIDLSPGGKSISIKLSNIRFRFFDFLLEVFGIGLLVIDPDNNPASLVVGAIRFVRRLKELTTVEITRQEAEVLLALIQLQVEKEEMTIDHLLGIMGGVYSEHQILKSLDTLEKLSCIKHTYDGVWIIERYVIL